MSPVTAKVHRIKSSKSYGSCHRPAKVHSCMLPIPFTRSPTTTTIGPKKFKTIFSATLIRCSPLSGCLITIGTFCGLCFAYPSNCLLPAVGEEALNSSETNYSCTSLLGPHLGGALLVFVLPFFAIFFWSKLAWLKNRFPASDALKK
jgi:hypothetical protein